MADSVRGRRGRRAKDQLPQSAAPPSLVREARGQRAGEEQPEAAHDQCGPQVVVAEQVGQQWDHRANGEAEERRDRRDPGARYLMRVDAEFLLRVYAQGLLGVLGHRGCDLTSERGWQATLDPPLRQLFGLGLRVPLELGALL